MFKLQNAYPVFIDKIVSLFVFILYDCTVKSSIVSMYFKLFIIAKFKLI